jgi:hypothetical protein
MSAKIAAGLLITSEARRQVLLKQKLDEVMEVILVVDAVCHEVSDRRVCSFGGAGRERLIEGCDGREYLR